MNPVRLLPHFPPHIPNAPLQPDSAFLGAVIGNMSGNSFKPTSPNHPPRRPPPTPALSTRAQTWPSPFPRPSQETTPTTHATSKDREPDAAELIGGGTKTATTPPEPTKDLSKSANIIEHHFFTAKSLVQDARYAGLQGSGHELPAHSDPGANRWDGLTHSIRQLQVRWSGSRCSTRTPACS